MPSSRNQVPGALTDALSRVQSGLGVSSEIGDAAGKPAAGNAAHTNGKSESAQTETLNGQRGTPKATTTRPICAPDASAMTPARDPVPVRASNPPANGLSQDYSRGFSNSAGRAPAGAAGSSDPASGSNLVPQETHSELVGQRSGGQPRASHPMDDDAGGNVMQRLKRVDQILGRLNGNDESATSHQHANGHHRAGGFSNGSHEGVNNGVAHGQSNGLADSEHLNGIERPETSADKTNVNASVREPGARGRASVRRAATGDADSSLTSANLRKMMRELPSDWSSKVVSCADTMPEAEEIDSLVADERTVANAPPRKSRTTRKVLFMWNKAGNLFIYDETDDAINGIDIESRYEDWEVTPSDFQRYLRGSRRYPDKGIRSWGFFRRS